MRRKLRESLSTLADLAEVGTFFGLSVAGIFAALVAIVGWLTNIPWFWILVGSPIAAAFLLLCIVLAIRLRPSKPLDKLISDWKDHSSYSVWAASCLWVDREPWPSIEATHPAYPSLQKIKAALMTGEIQSLYGGTNMNAQVSREELIKLAQLTRERPKFLFPDK